MGNFYVNYTLRGPGQEQVASFLSGRSAIVTPVISNCLVVFDEKSDDQNGGEISEFAAVLSSEFHCPVLAVMNHDDDILWYQLHIDGNLEDEYDSTPGYFDSDHEGSSPERGDASKLCAAFESNAMTQVEGILRKSLDDDDGYVFAFERHADLVAALNLPSFAVAAGFTSIDAGECPDDLSEDELIHTKAFACTTEDIELPGYYQLVTKSADHRLNAISVPLGWLPQTWADLRCEKAELSADFWRATDDAREKFSELGFSEIGFKKLKRILNPYFRDGGAIDCLDAEKRSFGQIHYIKARPANADADVVLVHFSFTAVMGDMALACTNKPNQETVANPDVTVFRNPSGNLLTVHKLFREKITELHQPPDYLGDLNRLILWFDHNALRTLEIGIEQGMFKRMSNFEVAMARQRLR